MKYILSVAGLFVKENYIFLAQRKDEGNMSLKWELPGGKLEYGDDGEYEQAEQGLKREFKEEFEINNLIVGKYLSDTHFINENKTYKLLAYEVYFDCKYVLNDHIKAEFFDINYINNLDLVPSDKDILKNIKLIK